jgi:hypothetical protein
MKFLDNKWFAVKSSLRMVSLGVAALSLTPACSSFGQNFLLDSSRNFFGGMAGRDAEMRSLQPSGWPVALVTTTPALTQLYRAEFSRQVVTPGVPTWNVGNGKGLSLIMSKRVEFTAAIVPNYIFHNSAKTVDGFGDYSFSSKVRLFSGTNDHGNYAVSGFFTQSFSSGEAKNGSASYTRSYTLLTGKGFGKNFIAQSSGGVTVPASAGVKSIGHPVVWNTVAFQRLLPKLWLQVEDNATFYHGGSHDGKMQNYITPGLISGRLRPRSWSETDHRALVLEAAMQMGTSAFKTSNHNLIMDAKWVF